MASPTAMKPLLTLLLLLLHLHPTQSSDLTSLMSFKSSADVSNALNWNTSTDPCTFPGVSCINNRVTRLVLEGLNLHGTFSPLSSLTQLRVLSLKRNRLSGPIPDLSDLKALKLLFLSDNELSGTLPDSLTSLQKLYRLDLSYNNLSGPIPATVNRLTHLLTFRIESNRFTGSIEGLDLPGLTDFNVSGNRLTGRVPPAFSRFPASVFGGNEGLCGAPLEECKGESGDVTQPKKQPGGATSSPPSSVVASSPSSMPINTTPLTHEKGSSSGKSSSKMSPVVLMVIVVGDVLALVAISVLLYCFFCRVGRRGKEEEEAKRAAEGFGDKNRIVYSAGTYNMGIVGGGGGERGGKMVFFQGVRRFELEDLLKASAEMLGKGGFGTAYKAVLDDGNVVAVKRLREVGGVVGKREFEQHMELLGRLRHENVVSLVAYYFARDEKLLVYEYMVNGSLFWLLHGMPLLLSSLC